MSEIDTMEAGEECDMAVAGAVGLTHERRIVDWGASGPKYSGCLVADDAYGEFHPSTDWNDAMYAAEAFGLWEKHEAALQLGYGRVVVMEHTGGRLYDGDIASAPTGQLAICRAILKLSRSKE